MGNPGALPGRDGRYVWGLMTDRPSLRDRKKLETRERLIEAGMTLFAERGFDDTTADDIAEAADVSRATLFNYFASKEAILLEYHERLSVRVKEIGDTVLAGEAPRGVRAAFEEYYRLLGEHVVGEGERARVLVRTLQMAPSLQRSTAAATVEALAVYRECLSRGAAAGELRPDLDVAAGVQLVAGAWSIALLSWAFGKCGDPGQVMHQQMALIFEGLLPRA
jgi:AcrR family transcriptional regulator